MGGAAPRRAVWPGPGAVQCLLRVDFVLGDGEVGPGARPRAGELGDAAFFDQGVAVGRGAGIEPQPGKPDEQK